MIARTGGIHFGYARDDEMTLAMSCWSTGQVSIFGEEKEWDIL
jgi:hypothetical protein